MCDMHAKYANVNASDAVIESPQHRLSQASSTLPSGAGIDRNRGGVSGRAATPSRGPPRSDKVMASITDQGDPAVDFFQIRLVSFLAAAVDWLAARLVLRGRGGCACPPRAGRGRAGLADRCCRSSRRGLLLGGLIRALSGAIGKSRPVGTKSGMKAPDGSATAAGTITPGRALHLVSIVHALWVAGADAGPVAYLTAGRLIGFEPADRLGSCP